MERKVVYVVDEDDAARNANCRDLRTLLVAGELDIRALAPFKFLAEYDELLAKPDTAAFILDQRMRTSGVVSYDGTDLARHIRGIDAKIPIYILTGHPDDDAEFEGANYLVEHIIGKDWIEDPTSELAITAKARILRHIAIFDDVRKVQEQRFHDLLVKSIREGLTQDEQDEMNRLEYETAVSVAAAERSEEAKLLRQIKELQDVIGINGVR